MTRSSIDYAGRPMQKKKTKLARYKREGEGRPLRRLSWHHQRLAIKRWVVIRRVRVALGKLGVKTDAETENQLVKQPISFIVYWTSPKRKPLQQQNEHLTFGGMWTYDHPAFTADRGEASDTGATEGEVTSSMCALQFVSGMRSLLFVILWRTILHYAQISL